MANKKTRKTLLETTLEVDMGKKPVKEVVDPDTGFKIIRLTSNDDIKTGSSFQGGTIVGIRKNDEFSSLVDVKYDSGKTETFLVS